MKCDGRRSCGGCLRPNFTTDVMLLTGKVKMYYLIQANVELCAHSTRLVVCTRPNTAESA